MLQIWMMMMKTELRSKNIVSGQSKAASQDEEWNATNLVCIYIYTLMIIYFIQNSDIKYN